MYLRIINFIILMNFYSQLIVIRDVIVNNFFTKIIGIYDENKESILFPNWLYFFYMFPFLSFMLKKYDINYIYNNDNIIYYSQYDNTNDIYPVVSSVNLFDSNNNQINISNIMKGYHLSVPLKIIYLNEKFIGDYILVKYFSRGRKEKKLLLSNLDNTSFGKLLK